MSSFSQSSSGQYAYSEQLMPQAEMLEDTSNRRVLQIGMPKEIDKYENRVLLSPQAVKQLCHEGHSIIIESGAGAGCQWSDADYSKAGALIETKKKVFQAEIILKVASIDEEEIKLLKGGQLLISALHFNTQTVRKINALKAKRMTCVAMELIRNKNNFHPYVHTMSEISGILSIKTASEYLSNPLTSKGILLGGITGIPAAKVLIFGAGTAGEYAARAALALGAQVNVFDNSLNRLQVLKNKLGIHLFTSVLHFETIVKALKNADVVIGAMEENKENRDFKIRKKMIAGMKKGSVIIDLNTDSNSCIETSVPTHLGNPAFEKYGIIHYCVPNIASKVAKTASIALSNATFPLLQKISRQKTLPNIIKNIVEIKYGTYMYESILTNERLGEKLNLDYKDIDLLSAIF